MTTLLRLAGVSLAFLVATGPARAAAPATATSEPLFSRHVIPLMARLGCNAGVCHGAVQGQGGFRLSLFGAEPALDHQRILREHMGRRLNLLDPDNSLLLLKATGRAAHGGGVRLAAGGPEYQMLRAWIAVGARLDDPAKSRVASLLVTPASHTGKVGATHGLRVEARFEDGTAEDVTRLCTFDSTDKAVAEVDAAGRVTALGVGDVALVVRYRGQPAVASLLVPGDALTPFPEVPPRHFIDRHVLDKLRRLNLPPSPTCDDATFLRRVSLDVAGELPTADEVRRFLADGSADKREKKIDELLARPGHAAVWATRFCDILKPTGFNGNYFTEHLEARRFHGWLRARLQEGIRYDDLVERILTATSREGRPAEAYVAEMRALIEEEVDSTRELKTYTGRRTLDLYWQKGRGKADGGNTPVKSAIQVAHAFLGLRLACAQCHRHPHDVWQQADLLDFASFFAKVSQAGGNSRALPDVAALFDGKAAAEEQKKKRVQAKALTERVMKEKNLPKEEADRLRKEAAALEAEARILYGMGRRINTEIHTAAPGAVAEARSPLGQQKASQFRLLGQAEAVQVADGQDPRAVVMAWMRRPDNPFFARAIVNRVWAHYFGRGLIDPADQLSPLNPASHPELLQELSDGFVKSGFDLRWLHRAIVTSEAYQRSSAANAANGADTRNYARFQVRRLPAELVLDAIDHATGGSEAFPAELRMPPGSRVLDLAGSVPANRDNPRATALAYALQVFGRPLRSAEVQCDCERENNASMLQTIYLINHPEVREKLASPQGRVAAVVKAQADDAGRVEEAFLWVLGRLPSPEERTASLAYLKASATPQKGVEGLFRTLLLSDEFILNH